MRREENHFRTREHFFRAAKILAGICLLAGNCFCSSAQTNLPAPVTATDFFNAGTKFFAATNFAEAERMFRSALAAQDERVQPLAEYNLGETRFADGAEILKKGPDAEKISDQGRAALAEGGNALQAGESAMAENNISKMVDAYLAGRGARRELRAAEKAVKSALETFGKTLARWQRSLDDFKGAAELNPADTNATQNAKFVEKKIAELIDRMQMMMQMAGQMAQQREQLAKMLNKMKGQIPAQNAPPGKSGEDDEDDNPDGKGKGDVKPESLAGKEEGEGREGEQMRGQLAPDQAGQILDALPVDGSRRLPMGGDKEGAPAKDRKGRNW